MATTEAPAALSTLESFNPATGELVGSVATITPDQVQAVVDDVARIQPAWAELSLEDRAGYMRRAADALLDEIDEIAELLVHEQGKPRTEAYTMELLPTVDALHWCAKAGPKILADEKVRMSQAFLMSKKSRFSYEPIGVVGVIAPWNYPWSIPFGEVAIALMAGNGVVLKPASLTPLLGEAIRRVFEKGGLPEGLVRVVHGGGAVGDALARSSVGKVFFTGSVEVGRKVGEVCAAAAQGLGAGAGRQGPDDRLRRRRPRQRHLRRRLGRLRQRRPDLLGDRACLRPCARSPTASSRASPARRRSCGSATRWSGRPRSAR